MDNLRLLGAYQIVEEEPVAHIFPAPDLEDGLPNQVRLLLKVESLDGPRTHPGTSHIAISFSDQKWASAFFSRLAQEVLQR